MLMYYQSTKKEDKILTSGHLQKNNKPVIRQTVVEFVKRRTHGQHAWYS